MNQTEFHPLKMLCSHIHQAALPRRMGHTFVSASHKVFCELAEPADHANETGLIGNRPGHEIDSRNRLRHTGKGNHAAKGNRPAFSVRYPNWNFVGLTIVFSLSLLFSLNPSFADSLSREAKSGPVTVTVLLDPDKPQIGDILSLTITVLAEKNVEVLMPEFGDALERFSIVDFAPKQSLDNSGRSVLIQKYRLQTPSSGKQAIPPILIEYVDRRPGQKSAPEGLDAFEVMTERIEFEVQSVVPQGAAAKLKPALGKLGPRERSKSSKWPWYAAGIVLAALIVPLAVRAWIAMHKRARRRSAYEIAKQRLDRLLARPRPTSEQVDGFYVELSAIVRRYLEDRFDLRAPELTTEEFLASVGKSGSSVELSREHHGLLREFLRQADLVKFAGVQPSNEDIDRSIHTAARFLDETRENAPLLEEAVHSN